MPSASDELREMFSGPEEALTLLDKHFTEKAGCIYPKDNAYNPTLRENAAINYLVYEWDYGYEHEAKI